MKIISNLFIFSGLHQLLYFDCIKYEYKQAVKLDFQFFHYENFLKFFDKFIESYCQSLIIIIVCLLL